MARQLSDDSAGERSDDESWQPEEQTGECSDGSTSHGTPGCPKAFHAERHGGDVHEISSDRHEAEHDERSDADTRKTIRPGGQQESGEYQNGSRHRGKHDSDEPHDDQDDGEHPNHQSMIQNGRRMRITIALALGMAAVLAAQPAPLPRASPESVGLNPTRLKEASALLNQFVTDGKIAGAVASVARRGKVAYLETVGFQNLESRAPMTERSLFRIYSMAKAVTAVSAMILHEEGKFDLRDPVSKYLPEFRNVRVLEPGGQSRPPTREIDRGRSPAAHFRAEPPDVRALSNRKGSFAIYHAAAVHHQHRPHSADGRSWYALSVQRRHDRRRQADRNLVGQAARRLHEGTGVRSARHGGHRLLGAAEQRARLTTVYAAQQGGGLRAYEIEEVPFTERPALLEGRRRTAVHGSRFHALLPDVVEPGRAERSPHSFREHR